LKIFNKQTTKEKRRACRKNPTPAESVLWEQLRAKKFLNLKFYRQYGIGEYIADFYCPEKKLVIEIDGLRHYTTDGLSYDKIREEFMKSLEITTLRFSNHDIEQNMENVLIQIRKTIDGK
jgi:very-short-patch-repair endonuclease